MFNLRKFGPYFDSDPAAGGSGDPATNPADPGGAGLTLDSWIEALEDADQKESVKTLLGKHVGKLKSALDSERVTRKEMEGQVRDLAKAADDGSDSQVQLTQFADDLEKAGQKSDFYEAAHLAGASNLKLAYMAAVQDELFDRRGNVDFAKMKENYPELFAGELGASGNAGSGTETTIPEGKAMNNWIRTETGRQ